MVIGARGNCWRGTAAGAGTAPGLAGSFGGTSRMFEGGSTGSGKAGTCGDAPEASSANCSVRAASEGSLLSANCVACRAASRSPSTEDRINEGRIGACSEGASTVSAGAKSGSGAGAGAGVSVATATPAITATTTLPAPASASSRARPAPSAEIAAPCNALRGKAFRAVPAMPSAGTRPAPPATALRAAVNQPAPSLAAASSSPTIRRACSFEMPASRSSTAAALGPCSASSLIAKNQSCSEVRRLSSGVPAQGETRKLQYPQA